MRLVRHPHLEALRRTRYKGNGRVLLNGPRINRPRCAFNFVDNDIYYEGLYMHGYSAYMHPFTETEIV